METVAAEAGKEKNNKEGQDTISFMKTTKVQKVLQRGYQARTYASRPIRFECCEVIMKLS